MFGIQNGGRSGSRRVYIYIYVCVYYSYVYIYIIQSTLIGSLGSLHQAVPNRCSAALFGVSVGLIGPRIG